MDTKTYTNLHTLGCLLVDLPESRYDCSISNATACIRCQRSSTFFSGESVDDFSGSGHIICVLIWLLTLLLGTVGSLGNILIVQVINRRQSVSFSPFNICLKALAVTDLMCCVCCVMVTTAVIVYYENWSRNVVTIYVFWLSGHTSLFANSASSFLTVAITIERYLAVAFPLKCKRWANKRMTCFLICGVLLFALLLALPRYLSTKVGTIGILKDVESTKDIDYVILSTSHSALFYNKMNGYFNQVDFWAPLPLLFLFNGLLYYHVLKLSKSPIDLNLSQCKEIRAVKMFFPVVLVLFLCNIIPILHYSLIVSGFAYRELDMAMRLSFALNAAVNLPIYYYKATLFKQETKPALMDIFHFSVKWLKQKRKRKQTDGNGDPQICTGVVGETTSVTQTVQSPK